MKARIVRPAVPEGLVLYGAEEPLREKVCAAAQELALPCRAVGAEAAEMLVGTLVGWPDFEGKAGKEPAGAVPGEACLLMAGLSEDRLDRLLRRLKETGAAVSLKAVVTAHNKDWTLAALMRELAREREAFRQAARKPDRRGAR